MTALLLGGFIITIAALAISWKLSSVWIRANIPLPEDHPEGSEGEAAMIADFERLRRKAEAMRRQ